MTTTLLLGVAAGLMIANAVLVTAGEYLVRYIERKFPQ